MLDILKRESEAVMSIPVSDAYAEAIDLIVEHVNHRGGKLITSGMGESGTDSDEHRHYLQFDGHTRHLPTPLGGATWRLGHHAEERLVVAPEQ